MYRLFELGIRCPLSADLCLINNFCLLPGAKLPTTSHGEDRVRGDWAAGDAAADPGAARGAQQPVGVHLQTQPRVEVPPGRPPRPAHHRLA